MCNYIANFRNDYFSPTSSPDSPDVPPFSNHSTLGIPVEDPRFTRSKSMSGMNSIASSNAASARMQRPDVIKTAVKNDINMLKRNDSDSNIHMRVLQKQVGNIGGIGNSSQDDDSLSGTESLDSDGKKKDKKKLKLIPRFMRRTET